MIVVEKGYAFLYSYRKKKQILKYIVFHLLQTDCDLLS